MTDSIKVWVPFLAGKSVSLPVYHTNEVMAWNDLSGRHLKLREGLISEGWTIEPMTLTKGHKE